MVETPYFDASKLPEPTPAYVVWIDVMGVQPTMSRSLPVTANFVFKLHAAILSAVPSGVVPYPVMDGAYVVAPTRATVMSFLREVMTQLANTFLAETEDRHRFIPRASLAFGPVIHGSSVSMQASNVLASAPHYTDKVLIGMPMIQALRGEPSAPPFGVFVHESARAFAPGTEKPFNQLWWPWWNNDSVRGSMLKALGEHYDWADRHHRAIGYDADRLRVHRSLVEEYFQKPDGQPPP
jgi:hypothetical protein